ncbi:FHA domain-containing protein [Candidatus Uabimicrobium sp. HlEnr_7]|uniref:FHA domain-containing protein n=1 Tax=Candidatus Uabimicrobium helgolandensis TaxID=3095367 RepID=UPI00355779B9
MAKVLLKFKNNIIQEFFVGAGPLTIGRTEDNTVCIDNLGISRNHARIIQANGEFFIEDLNSQNGTSVNSLPIKRCALRNKDEIGIGKQNKHSLIFYENDREKVTIFSEIAPTQRKDLAPPEETLQLGTRRVTASSGKEEKTSAYIAILEGNASPAKILLEKVLFIAGRGDNADLKIEGDYDSNVIFIISNRPTGFFLSPSTNVELHLDQAKITEVVQLKDGAIIEFQNIKMKFSAR